MVKRRLLGLGIAVGTLVGAGALVAPRDAVPAAHAAAPPGAHLRAVTPARLLDTRDGAEDTTVDGAFRGGGTRPAGTVVELDVTDRGGVPADARAVFLNLTAVAPDAAGHLTAYPCDVDRPTASHVNYTPVRHATPNGVLVGVGAAGTVCIYTRAATHLVADVTAYVPAGATPTPVTPARLLDTRTGATHVTVDGDFTGGGRVAPDQILELDVAGRGGVAPGAAAVFVNITAVEPAAAGHVTAFPCGGAAPLASHVNYAAGDVTANGALVGVSLDGKVCLTSRAGTDLVVDVTAYVPAGRAPAPVGPARLLDTRPEPQHVTIDGDFQHTGEVAAGQVVRLPVRNRGGVPPTATAVFLNVTAVVPHAPGYLTAFPCGSDTPKASHVNYVAGEVRPNGVLVGLGVAGDVCIFTLANTHMVVDVTAFVAADDGTGPGPGPDGPPGSPRAPESRCDEPGAEWGTLTPEQADLDGAELDAAIAASMAGNSFAVRVFRYGCLVRTDTGHPVNEAAQYESWSMAKSITAMVFGRAWTLGLIDPDDTLGEWIPEAGRLPGATWSHADLTLRNLLEQNSGLDLNPVRDYNIAMPDRVATALRTEIVAEPGTTFGYSQHGPALVAEAVSRAVAAHGYDDVQDFADRELFGPLGIARDDWYWRRDCAWLGLPAITLALLDALVDPTSLLDGGFCAVADPFGTGPGHTQGFFGLNMRPNDFARLGELMRRDGVWNDERLLSSAFSTEALTPNDTNGCHGWLIWINAGAPCAGPSGPPEPSSDPAPCGRDRDSNGLPADHFAFNGLLGQHVAVFPSQEIVIVRVGIENVTGDAFFEAGLTASSGSMGDLYRSVLDAMTDQTLTAPAPVPDAQLKPRTCAARTGLDAPGVAGVLTDPAATLGPLFLEAIVDELGLPLP